MPPTAWIRHVPAVHGPQPIEASVPRPSTPAANSAAPHQRPMVWEAAAEAIRVSRVPPARPHRRH